MDVKNAYKAPELQVLDGAEWTDDDRRLSRPFTAYEIEVFYYWFEFLRRSHRRHWSKIVKNDFDDVSCYSGELSDMSFATWWWRHNRLFRRIQLIDVKVLDEEDVDFFKSVAFGKKSGYLMLALCTELPRPKLLARLEEILNAYEAGREAHRTYLYDRSYAEFLSPNGGGPEAYGIFSERGATRRPSTRLLRNALDVYDMYEKRKGGIISIPKYAIEDEINKKRPKGDEVISRWDENGKRREEPSKQIQGATIARYKKYADTLIANVCEGVFPKYLA